MRGLLRNFGLKVGIRSRGKFEQRIRELTSGNPMLIAATEPMFRARAALRQELAGWNVVSASWPGRIPFVVA